MKKLPLLLVIIFLFSCEKDVDSAWSDRLINCYVRADTIILKPMQTAALKPAYKYSDLKLQIFGLEGMKDKPPYFFSVSDMSAGRVIYDTKGNSEITEEYVYLNNVHKDIIATKTRSVPTGISALNANIAVPSLFERLVSLDIYADEDYDAAHPAGTKLNDIARVTFYCIDEIATADDFSGVKQKLDLSNRDFEHTEPLDEFNAKKRKFMAYNFTITLTSPPAQRQDFVFRIDYEHENALLTVTSDPITVTP